MCAETACLVLRLEGPMQSWGTSSQYDRRLTDLLPSRSAIGGMLCAALGLDRGSEEECTFLRDFAKWHMLAMALPRLSREKEIPVRRMDDYHIIHNTAKAEGGFKASHITHRQYLQDASFRVFLTAERHQIERAGAALQNPVWGIWMGRKCCIPTAPVFAGIFATEQEAREETLPAGLSCPVSSRDAESFENGTDTMAASPLCFASDARSFAPRRVMVSYGEMKSN